MEYLNDRRLYILWHLTDYLKQKILMNKCKACFVFFIIIVIIRVVARG